jgi:hypothetical protein
LRNKDGFSAGVAMGLGYHAVEALVRFMTPDFVAADSQTEINKLPTFREAGT